MVIISDIQLPKDSNGILKVSDVSTAAASDLSARTDPTNPSTSKFIQADANNNLGVYLGNGEGGGSLNSTEYPAVQVAGYDGTNFSSLQIGRTGRLETYNTDKNGTAQALLGTAGATAILGDSTITPTADPEGRDGWNFVNSVAATKFNLYYFNGNQEIITLEKISSVFAKVYINNFASLSGAPFFHIYTKPQGAGDAGAFYRSRIDYEIDSSVIVGIGEQVILWGENLPNTPCNNRLIQLKTKTTNGPALGTEEVLYITLSTNSSATINEKNITVSSMGFNTSDMGGTNGIINREFKLLSGGSGGATETTLSALNDKISKGSDDSIAAATGLQQNVIYGRNDGTGDLKAIKCGTDGNLHVFDADITSGNDATLSTAQQVLVYGRSQSGNLDAINVDNNGHLKITINDIEAGIINSINTNATRKNVYNQVLTNVNISIGNSTTSSAITAINGSNFSTITIYIHTGAGTSQSNFSYEVHKSYDGTHYFFDSNFTFSALGSDVNANPQPAVVATYGFDAQFIRVKVNNVSESNTTAINAYINERQ